MNNEVKNKLNSIYGGFTMNNEVMNKYRLEHKGILLYLDLIEYSAVKKYADKNNISVSEAIRKCIRKELSL